MPFMKTLGELKGVPEIFKLSPKASIGMIDFHEALLRGPSPLTEAERELIAAYVSGLNKCHYCFNAHAGCAEAYGYARMTLETMIENPEGAGLDEKILPMLAYARKMTREPSSVTQEDADAVYAAGWSELALHHAIMTVCCFNFMNRLLEGHGVKGDAEELWKRGAMLKEFGYAPINRMLEPLAAVEA